MMSITVRLFLSFTSRFTYHQRKPVATHILIPKSSDEYVDPHWVSSTSTILAFAVRSGLD